MRSFIYALALALTSVQVLPQNTGAPAQPGSPEQASTPAEPKGHTVIIGCLSGPDASGKYTLRSMEHRTGVEVFGSDDLKKGSGDKVKLTGSWKPGDAPAEKVGDASAVKGGDTSAVKPGDTSAAKRKASRKFQASEVEVMSAKCEAPAEKTPISKRKQENQQQKQQSSPPATPDSSNPK